MQFSVSALLCFLLVFDEVSLQLSARTPKPPTIWTLISLVSLAKINALFLTLPLTMVFYHSNRKMGNILNTALEKQETKAAPATPGVNKLLSGVFSSKIPQLYTSLMATASSLSQWMLRQGMGYVQQHGTWQWTKLWNIQEKQNSITLSITLRWHCW